jgi:hypothetical protein
MDGNQPPTPIYAFYQRYNPLCQLDWRWRRAKDLARRDAWASPRLDDPPTCTAVKYIKTVTAAGNSECAEQWPDLAIVRAARQLHRHGGHDRVLVEAYGLTQLDIQEIASRFDRHPAVLTTYFELFYDIRERRQARIYLFKHAIGSDKASADASRLLKLFALYGGPLVVDVLGRDLLLAGEPGGQPSNPAVRPLLEKWLAVMRMDDPRDFLPAVVERATSSLTKPTSMPSGQTLAEHVQAALNDVDWAQVREASQPPAAPEQATVARHAASA